MTKAKKETKDQDQQQPPQIIINSQYIRDLSFENPNAPYSLIPTGKQPQIDINFNVTSKKITPPDVKEEDKDKDHLVEVSLIFKAVAKVEDKVSFVVELAYAGVFTVSHLSDEHKHYLVNIEGPRILFPFSRSIIAQVTREGGFPPLLLNPLDFAALYQQKVQNMQKDEKESPTIN